MKAIFNFKFNKVVWLNVVGVFHAMLVCLCKAVSDRDVARALADGARSVEDVVRCTGAGTGCGMCRDSLACAVNGGCPLPPVRTATWTSGARRFDGESSQLVPLRRSSAQAR